MKEIFTYMIWSHGDRDVLSPRPQRQGDEGYGVRQTPNTRLADASSSFLRARIGRTELDTPWSAQISKVTHLYFYASEYLYTKIDHKQSIYDSPVSSSKIIPLPSTSSLYIILRPSLCALSADSHKMS